MYHGAAYHLHAVLFMDGVWVSDDCLEMLQTVKIEMVKVAMTCLY